MDVFFAYRALSQVSVNCFRPYWVLARWHDYRRYWCILAFCSLITGICSTCRKLCVISTCLKPWRSVEAAFALVARRGRGSVCPMCARCSSGVCAVCGPLRLRPWSVLLGHLCDFSGIFFYISMGYFFPVPTEWYIQTIIPAVVWCDFRVTCLIPVPREFSDWPPIW